MKNRFFLSKAVQFLLSSVVLAIYAVEVCPFIDTLSRQTLYTIFFSAFAIVFVVFLIVNALLPQKIMSQKTSGEI